MKWKSAKNKPNINEEQHIHVYEVDSNPCSDI